MTRFDLFWEQMWESKPPLATPVTRAEFKLAQRCAFECGFAGGVSVANDNAEKAMVLLADGLTRQPEPSTK